MKQTLQALYHRIAADFDAGASGETLMRSMASGVDAMLVEAWHRHAPVASKQVDLIAVGGYGRGELAPQSDWDLWFLVPEKMDEAVAAEIQSFLYAMWDTKAKVGYAVRNLKETAAHVAEEWDSATAATESRLLCGEGVLYREMKQKLGLFLKRKRKAFVEAKQEEFENRHRRTGGTAFLMEPDIKEGKGGLRDIQAIFWMAKAWYGSPDMSGLVADGVVSETEWEHLIGARDFLWRCRVGLHLETGRPNERMGFEQQHQLSLRMGYVDSPEHPAVDAFMKDYFRHAGRIARVTGMLDMHFQEQLHPQRFTFTRNIGDGFTLEGLRVGVEDDQVFKTEPLRLLRIFNVAQEGHRRLSSQALRQIRADVLLIDDAFRASSEANGIFMKILRHSRNVAWALKEMNDTGVLGRFIPEFRDVVGLGQFNRYHAYTVDEHTIRAVGEARNMFHEDRDIRLPLAHDVWHKIDRPELLYIALLFHDIAKGMPGDHSENGAVLARRFCERLQLSRDACDLVTWLVKEHLTMAIASQRSDLSDPEVIRRFADFVSDMERMNYLLLLTVADIAAVGPAVWNDWKGALLRDLYLATARVLMGEEGGSSEALQVRIVTRIESVLARSGAAERPALAAAAALLPWRCVMAFPPYQLQPVVALLARVDGGEGVELFVDERRCETMVMVVAKSRPGLFAILTSAIASGHVNVVAAQAYALEDGRVLDVFHVQNQANEPLMQQTDIQRLRQRIAHALATEVMLVPPKVAQPKISVLMRHAEVGARELPLASSRQTAIEVTAADRPGLLAQYAYVISSLGYDIRGAAISSFGERIVDVFFLQGKSSAQLTPEEVTRLCDMLVEAGRLPEERE